jgi:hypothetical protein
MTDRDKPLTGTTAADPISAEACKAQLQRLIADQSLHPRIRAAGIARRFREALSTGELTCLTADLSGELQRLKTMQVDAQAVKHHGRRLAVLEAAVDVLRVRSVASG